MRCHSCNAPLSIEDEKCPYCGTPNPEAVKHRQAMKRFSGEFHQTKSSVLKTSSETAQKYVRIITICVLTVLLLIAFALFANTWNITSAIHDAKATANAEKYCELLDEYEARDDALSFTAFYDQNYLYSVDAFEQYHYYYQTASQYESIYYSLMQLSRDTQEEPVEAQEIRRLCDSIEYYYTHLEQERYDFYIETGMYDEVHLDAIERLTAKLENLLAFYLGASQEEMEEFKTFSITEKQLFIERRLGSL